MFQSIVCCIELVNLGQEPTLRSPCLFLLPKHLLRIKGHAGLGSFFFVCDEEIMWKCYPVRNQCQLCFTVCNVTVEIVVWLLQGKMTDWVKLQTGCGSHKWKMLPVFHSQVLTKWRSQKMGGSNESIKNPTLPSPTAIQNDTTFSVRR